MTQLTAVMFLTFLVNLFPGKTISLVWDRSHTHFGDFIDSWVENYNEEYPSAKLIKTFIEAGMTSVMEVCDICVNKPLKEHIRNAYWDTVTSGWPGWLEKDCSREKDIKSLEKLYRDLLKTHLWRSTTPMSKIGWISSEFRQCCQGPYCLDRSAFNKHLNSLSENAIYAQMEKAAATMELK